MKLYGLSELRTFVAVVDAGSFSRAAVRLESSTPVVSRRVAALEKALGVRLFNRTTRRVKLTESGTQYYEDVVTALAALEEARERITRQSQTLGGSLKVASPMTFGTRHLAPLLPAFLTRHPELRIQLHLDDRLTDLVSEGLDMAIRIGQLQDSSLVAQRIASVPRMICASPEYLAREGEPKTAEDLRHHQCLHYSNASLRGEWLLRGPQGPMTVAVGGPLCANNGEVLLEAALQHMGIALLPSFIAQQALGKGALRELLPDCAPSPLGLYVVRPSRRYTPARVRGFIEYLQRQFGDR